MKATDLDILIKEVTENPISFLVQKYVGLDTQLQTKMQIIRLAELDAARIREQLLKTEEEIVADFVRRNG